MTKYSYLYYSQIVFISLNTHFVKDKCQQFTQSNEMVVFILLTQAFLTFEMFYQWLELVFKLLLPLSQSLSLSHSLSCSLSLSLTHSHSLSFTRKRRGGSLSSQVVLKVRPNSTHFASKQPSQQSETTGQSVKFLTLSCVLCLTFLSLFKDTETSDWNKSMKNIFWSSAAAIENLIFKMKRKIMQIIFPSSSRDDLGMERKKGRVKRKKWRFLNSTSSGWWNVFLSFFLSVAIGQRPGNYSSCRCSFCCSSPFVSFPL